MLEVKLLGAFEVKRAGKPVTISSRPAQSLFAYLILNAGTAHRREKLAGLLWPDSTEESARDYLRHGLWRIRKAIEAAPARGKAAPYIMANDISISFNAESPYSLDTAMLEDLDLNSASVDKLMSTLSLYEGELLPGFYDEWVVLEREHLQSIFEQKMAQLLALLESQFRWADLLTWGERWIALGQKPEAAYRALMSAYSALGDRVKLAATYERCTQSLREFGMDPSEKTQALYERLKSGKEAPNAIFGKSNLVADQTHSAPIPIPLTSFVGREKELKEIARLFATCRLLTLQGPGGVGKTRLAIHTAHDIFKKFGDGVGWVELVGLSDPALVPQAVAKTLGIHEISNQPPIETLVESLRTRHMMLVLDNCEHLISACAQLAGRLLAECPKLKILATSREALDIPGEITWQVPSLALPDLKGILSVKSLSRFESIHLFSARAASVQPFFELTQQNASQVVQICRHLDGIPLAIELAAARVKMMTTGEIAERLDDCFDLLTAGGRTALPRHQTLRATIDWSYDLLSESERTLFSRLSVFAGGFTLESAEAVAAGENIPRSQVVDLLGQLINKSLITKESGSEHRAGGTRYGMLETIREYARKKLEEAGEAERVKDRHLEFFAAFARQAESGINSVDQVAWFNRLDREADNLRDAMDWTPAGTPDNDFSRHALLINKYVIIGSLTMFWEGGYRREIVDALSKVLASADPSEMTTEKAKALYVGGFLLWSLNKYPEARAYLEESIAIAEKIGDRLSLAWALSFLGWTFDSLGEFSSAKDILERSLAIARSLGETGKHAVGQSLGLIGDIPYWQGDLDEACRWYEEAISFLREIHNVNMMTYPLRRLGYLKLGEKDFDRAAELFSESLRINQQIGHFQGKVACLVGFAAIELARDKLKKAAILMGCAESLLERIGVPLFFADMVEYKRCIARLKELPEEKVFSSAWSEGSAMSLEKAMRLALETED
jgi:predicted ATPase/DNA-binding SARP family transcriptional activator